MEVHSTPYRESTKFPMENPVYTHRKIISFTYKKVTNSYRKSYNFPIGIMKYLYRKTIDL